MRLQFKPHFPTLQHATAALDNFGDEFDTYDAVLDELNETEAKHIASSIVPRFDPVDTKYIGELI